MVVLRPISYWYFVALFILGAIFAAYGLRQNNLRAIELREQVIEADKNDGDIEGALQELRQFTYSHMNAGLSSETGVYPPVQLKYSYERAVAKELERAERSNIDLYNEAQEYCESTIPQGTLGAGRIPCITSYIEENGSAAAQPKKVPEDLYKFDFAAPRWSPDLAGWSIVVAALSLVLLVLRLLAQLWLKFKLEH